MTPLPIYVSYVAVAMLSSVTRLDHIEVSRVPREREREARVNRLRLLLKVMFLTERGVLRCRLIYSLKSPFGAGC